MENSERIMKCTQCDGNDFGKKADGTYFCRSCGAPVRMLSISSMKPKCIKCGSEDIGDKFNGGKFCRKCGADVIACAQCGGYEFSKGFDGNLFCTSCGATGKDLFEVKKEEQQPPVTKVEIKTEPKVTESKITTKVPSNLKDKLFYSGIVVAVFLIVILATIFLVKGTAPLENTWVFGANTLVFSEDGSFDFSLGGLSTQGTYTVEGDTIHLSYKYLGLLDKELDWKYEIKGKNMTVDGDVTLAGSGVTSSTVTYEAEKSNGALKIVFIIIEIVAAAGVLLLINLKKKRDI